MENEKNRLLLQALREVLIQLIGALEDFLGIEYSRSALAKRRERGRVTK